MYYPDLGIDIPDSVLGLSPSADPATNTQNGINYEAQQFNLNRQYLADSMAKLGISPAEQQSVLNQWDSAPSHDAAMQVGTPYMQKYAAATGQELDPTSWSMQYKGFTNDMKDSSFTDGALKFAAIMAAAAGGVGALQGAGAGTTAASVGGVSPGTFGVPDLLAASQAPGSSLMTALGTAGGAGSVASYLPSLFPTAGGATSALGPIANAGEVVVGSGGGGTSLGTIAGLGGAGAALGAGLSSGTTAGLNSPVQDAGTTYSKAPNSFLSTNGVPLAAGGLLGAAGIGNTISDSSLGSSDPAMSGAAAGGGLMSKLGDSIGNFLSGPTLIPSLLNLGGSLIGANAASKAADTQASAARDATNAQLSMFNTINDQQAPYRQAGYTALSDLMGKLGPNGSLSHTFGPEDLKTNLAPNYDFQLQQGLGATRNAANLQTGLLSGNTLKGINDYAQNFAGNSYQQAFENYNTNQTNIYNRLSNIAGLGQTAGTASTTGAPSFANGISNTLTGAGAAQAAGQVGSANAISGGLNNVASWYALPQIMAANGAAGR